MSKSPFYQTGKSKEYDAIADHLNVNTLKDTMFISASPQVAASKASHYIRTSDGSQSSLWNRKDYDLSALSTKNRNVGSGQSVSVVSKSPKHLKTNK